MLKFTELNYSVASFVLFFDSIRFWEFLFEDIWDHVIFHFLNRRCSLNLSLSLFKFIQNQLTDSLINLPLKINREQNIKLILLWYQPYSLKVSSLEFQCFWLFTINDSLNHLFKWSS